MLGKLDVVAAQTTRGEGATLRDRQECVKL